MVWTRARPPACRAPAGRVLSPAGLAAAIASWDAGASTGALFDDGGDADTDTASSGGSLFDTDGDSDGDTGTTVSGGSLFDTDGDTDGVAPEAPTTAPEVPAVVQTDGAALETPAPLAPVGLGLLAVGGLVGVLRRLARA